MTTAELSVVLYDVTPAEIASTKAKYSALTCDTPEGYEEVRKAIGFVRDTRVRIEKRRVELKADALAYGRRVDASAKELTDLILDIEIPLKAKKTVIDDEKERVRRAAEEKIRLEMEVEAKARRDAEEAARQAAHAAEAARLAEERERQRVERDALEAQRKYLAAEREAERQRALAELARANEERRKADDAARKVREAEERRIAAERAELDKQKAIEQAKRDAADRAERERITAEEQRLSELERQARIAKLLPIAEQILAFASALAAVPLPVAVKGNARKALIAIMGNAHRLIESLAEQVARGEEAR